MCPPGMEWGAAGSTEAWGRGAGGDIEDLDSRMGEASPTWVLRGGPGLLGEAGQRCRVGRVQTHLADVVEISVWHLLLGSQLFHLIEQHMHLELGAQVLQPAVAERLSGGRRTRPGAQGLQGSTCRGLGSRAEAAGGYRTEAAEGAAGYRKVWDSVTSEERLVTGV